MANKKRLIDANEFNRNSVFLCGGFVGDAYYNGYCHALDRVQEALEHFPTVDAVEVVRCKDCKHGIWDEGEQMWECLLTVDLDGDSDTYAMFHEFNDGEHFCSYGERKDT